MRRLSLLVALMVPLVGVALEGTPDAAACTPPTCRLQECEFTIDRPTFHPETLALDPGLVGVDCSFGGEG